MSGSVSWTVKGGRVLGPAPFLVAGIVNVTADSFYDGGRHPDPGSGLDHARVLLDQGAHILDIGGESSRPGAVPVTADEELARVLPVVSALASSQAVVSVDTYRASTAAAALDAGAAIINDISACRFDPALTDVLVHHKPGYVLMHSLGRPETMQQAPGYTDVVAEILSFLEHHLSRLVKAGLPEDRITIDPGIGFGKTLDHNLTILRHLHRFHSLGRPVFLGLSNKSMFQALLGLPVHERGNATQAATAIAAWSGTRIHRVHDVLATLQTLRVVEALRDPC